MEEQGIFQVENIRPNTQMEEGDEKIVAIDPRVFVCSFPKSGTHLVEQMIQPFVYRMPAEKPWAGTFLDHSWTVQWSNIRNTLRRIGWIDYGTYGKGHLGYNEILEAHLYGMGVALLFVYRDPRDVVVSLAHHIMDGQTHSRNEWYQEMGFDATLLAVIKGLGPYAGVMERWNEYAGWLDVPWVLKLRFSDLVGPDKREWCEKILRYVVGHCAAHRGFNAELDVDVMDNVADRMIKNSERTDRSPTFRRGVAGGWRDEFKAGHCVAFADTDVRWAEEYGLEEPWLVHLGYEDDMFWWQNDEEDDEAEGKDEGEDDKEEGDDG